MDIDVSAVEPTTLNFRFEQSSDACNDAGRQHTPMICDFVYHNLGAAEHRPGPTFLFRGTLGKKKCSVLFDTGASISFVNAKWLADSAQNEKQGCNMYRSTLSGQKLPSGFVGRVEKLQLPINIATADDKLVQLHEICTSILSLQGFL
eukprot:1147645-Pelagomonas_calceolata.AAC.2